MVTNDYNVGEEFVVRVAALPVSALADLNFTGTWAAVRAILARRRYLAGEAENLAGELYGLIGEHRESELKPRLVALRRALHNGRRPGTAAWSPSVREVLPAGILARIDAWLDGLKRQDDRLRELSDLLGQEKIEKQRVLRQHVATDVFGHGLVQGSPTLSAELGKWLAAGGDSAPDRKVLLRLVKYLARVVAKTSPYATFTFSGLGQWAPNSPAVQPTGHWSWCSVVEPNIWVIQRLAKALSRETALARPLRIRVNPSVAEEDGRLWFFAPGRSERVVGIGISDTVRECVDFVLSTDDCTVMALREHLGPHGGTAAAERYLNRLIEIGLLEAQLPFADQSPDHLKDLLEWMDCAVGRSSGAGKMLGEVRTALREYPRLKGTSRRHGYHEHVSSLLGEMLTAYGDPADGEQTPPRKNLFHENAVLRVPVLECGREPWRPAFDDLNVLRRFLAVFQHDLSVKLVAARVFVSRFGAENRVPFTHFYRGLVDLLRTSDPLSPEIVELRALLLRTSDDRHAKPQSDVPEVRELARLRQEALATLRAQPPGADGSIAVDTGVLEKLMATWPDQVSPARSLSWYVQRTDVNSDEVRLVLNGVTAGYGQVRGRVHRMIDQAGVALPDRIRYTDATSLLAESGGSFGSNVNLRRAAVPFEIAYPGVVSDRQPEDRIKLAELVVAYDREQHRLRLLRGPDGPEVRPLHLGMMAGPLLPPVMRLLVTLFGETPNPATGTWALFADLPHAPPERVLAKHRVSVGRITVARASWHVRAGEIPRRDKGDSDAGYLLRLASWFDEQGIPERCFVRVLDLDTWERTPWRVSRARKPTYLDLANWFLVAGFERLLHGPGHLVIFQEVLPDFPAAPEFGEQGQHVTEYVVELSETEVRDD